MKKLLLILLCLFSFNTPIYAAFPITESSTEQISDCNKVSIVNPSLLADWWGSINVWVKILMIVVFMFIAYFTLILLCLIAFAIESI
jgi:hypothetical protein